MNTTNKKALIIVDVQPSFLNDRNRYVVDNIIKLLDESKYDLYVEENFHAEIGSLWEEQQGWICPEGPDTQTVKGLADKLKVLSPIKVIKDTKSAFKGDKDLVEIFNDHGVHEVHIVGLDTNDCVLATAYESFDNGFLTYVIEDCCQSSSSDKLHNCALELLKGQDMIK